MMIRGTLDWGSLGEDIAPYVYAAREFLDSEDEEIVAAEQPFGSLRLGYGCTPDLVRKVSIVEWKTTYRIYPEVAIQLAGQAKAVGGAKRRIAVQLLRDGQFKKHTFDQDQDFKDLEAARRIYEWKKRNKRLTS